MAPKKKADNRPPIFVAIDKGDEEAVEELLKDEANRDLKNKVIIMCRMTCGIVYCAMASLMASLRLTRPLCTHTHTALAAERDT